MVCGAYELGGKCFLQWSYILLSQQKKQTFPSDAMKNQCQNSLRWRSILTQMFTSSATFLQMPIALLSIRMLWWYEHRNGIIMMSALLRRAWVKSSKSCALEAYLINVRLLLRRQIKNPAAPIASRPTMTPTTMPKMAPPIAVANCDEKVDTL